MTKVAAACDIEARSGGSESRPPRGVNCARGAEAHAAEGDRRENEATKARRSGTLHVPKCLVKESPLRQSSGGTKTFASTVGEHSLGDVHRYRMEALSAPSGFHFVVGVAAVRHCVARKDGGASQCVVPSPVHGIGIHTIVSEEGLHDLLVS